MTLELSRNMEERLRELARRQSRDVNTVVEEAVRQYLEAAAITDLDSAEISETQVVLMNELSGIARWKDGGG